MENMRFVASVGFKVLTPFSANGAYKWEFEDILVSSRNIDTAEKTLTNCFGDDIIISYIKEIK